MAFNTRIRGGGFDVITETITDIDISTTASIQEVKLALDYSTISLYDNSVRIDSNRTIAEGIDVTFPMTGRLVKDAVNGKTYRETFENGVQKLTEEI